MFIPDVDAQSNLFTAASWKSNLLSLTTQQRIRYLQSRDTLRDSLLVAISIGDIASVQVGGRLKINIPGSQCGETTFRATHCEYQTDSNYLWYGELVPSDTCSCENGYLLLRSLDGEKFGSAKLEFEHYSIVDFGGVNAAIKLVDPPGLSDSSLPECEALPDTSGFIPESQTESRNEGACDVRVLILHSPNTPNYVSNVTNYAQECIDFTNQAMRNSKITSKRVNLKLAGITTYVPRPVDSTLLPILTNIWIGQDSNKLKYKCDLLVALVAKGELHPGSRIAGAANVGPQSNNPIAVIEISEFRGKNTFVHEVAHLFGCRHEDCDSPEATSFPSCDSVPLRYSNAHYSEYKKCCGFLGFGRCDVKQKTVMYSIHDSNEFIPYFSTPNITLNNRQIGQADIADNARQLVEQACTIAHFVDEPVPITSLNVALDGDSEILCGTGNELISASVSGSTGPYSYEWGICTDGINYVSSGTGSTKTIYGTDFAVGDIVFIRVKATSFYGIAGYAYHTIKVLDQPLPEGKYCNRGRPSFDSDLLKLSPNPATESLNVSFETGGKNPVSLCIYDVSGRVIKSVTLNTYSGTQNFSISLTDVQPGLYFLSLQDTGRRLFKTFVKANVLR